MSLPLPRTPHPSEAPSIRWGILAPGGIAHAFADALRKHTSQEIVAVGSRSADRAAAFAKEFGAERSYGSYEELVADDDVDAVYVASPHSHHAEQALLAIAAGKHVLVEKAFTPTADEARRVVSAAREADVTLMEAMWSRFLPHYDIVRQLLADGAFGELEVLTADHGQYFPFDPHHRLYDPALAGGAMLDLGVYPVSFASFVLGTPGGIRAVGTRAQTGVDRQVSMVFDGYADHPSAHAVLNTTLHARTPTRGAISGSDGTVELPGGFYGPQAVRWAPRDGEPEVAAEPSIRGHEGLAYQAAHFATLVTSGARESELLPLDETVAIVETMQEALRQV
ncbi:Gfo/Idh/MocA family oxidoreductase [Tessaracoccus sp. OS52]|uniref:Gfo/Idh/MocA family protein n=1 Tax=Tessaracoccus sp. OS52 TaxID=2886691 RepID=UPI001D0FCD12|nr:Gfo/Idh/MocA family oxidoreductase [Tessaracoccus sp. OS52]MCC2594674.1 Gfo/Idh/MocA family oxidoreductase [Tessaracoccus sp. OS52]